MSALKKDVEHTAAAKKRVAGTAALSGKPGTKTRSGTLATPSAARRVDAKMFTQIVAGEPLAGFSAVKVIREGYSARVLKSARHFFGVPDARIQHIAQVPASTANRLEKNAAKIDAAATERVYRMGTVTRMAIEVFENAAAAIEWMRQPNRALGNAAPLDLMDTEPGAVSVRQVLNAIATGGVA